MHGLVQSGSTLQSEISRCPHEGGKPPKETQVDVFACSCHVRHCRKITVGPSRRGPVVRVFCSTTISETTTAHVFKTGFEPIQTMAKVTVKFCTDQQDVRCG